MEEKKTSGIKIVLLVFAILFSIVLFPVFLGLPLAGGICYGSINLLSTENVEDFVRDSKISDVILDTAWDEIVATKLNNSVIKEDAMHKIFQEIITSADIEDTILATWRAADKGKEVDLDFSEIKQRANATVNKLFEQLPEDAFAAWKNGSSSEYFTDSLLEDAKVSVSNLFDGDTYELAKSKYEMTGATETFDDFINREWNEHKSELTVDGKDMLEEQINNAELEAEDKINEALQKSEVKDFFDNLHQAQGVKDVLFVAIYGIVLVLVLFLLIFYLFCAGGFYYTGIATLLGGGVCFVVPRLHDTLMEYVTIGLETVVKENNIETFITGKKVAGILETLVRGLEEDIWKFGRVSCIIGVILIGLGILRSVLKKKPAVEPQA